MNVVCIVQARSGGTRFPGKVLKPIGRYPSLYHTLHRTQAAWFPTVLAIPWADNELRDLGQSWGFRVVQGPEHDVLTRYAIAADKLGADIIVRITADCPLVDPAIIRQVVEPVASGKVLYACNVRPRTYPQGLDVEAFTFNILEQAHREAVEPYDREHVTPKIQRLARSNVANIAQDTNLSHHRWTLDTPEDYRFFQALAERLTWEPPSPTAAEVLALLDAEPELAAINAEVAHIYPPA